MSTGAVFAAGIDVDKLNSSRQNLSSRYSILLNVIYTFFLPFPLWNAVFCLLHGVGQVKSSLGFPQGHYEPTVIRKHADIEK